MMQRFLCLMGAMASLTMATACGSSINIEQERTSLLAVDREWSQTAKDPEAFLSYFSADAAVYSAGAPTLTGTDAIRKGFAEMSGAPGFALTWTPEKADVSASGDMGRTSGTYAMTTNGVTDTGTYLTVWKKQSDGAWKATDDMTSTAAAPPGSAGAHVMRAATDVPFGDPPPFLPPGARIAVVAGDPSQAQPFVIRAQMPAGYTIAPHWHPTTENLTVLSGTVAIGMGEAFDAAALKDLPTGGFASLPGGMRHFFRVKTAATIQVHAIGPMDFNYVNPADDPRNQGK